MSHPMDEPFDELMGMDPNKVQTDSTYTASTVTPDPSPTYGVASTSRGAGPPSNAFAHTTSKDRWAQYEKDGHKLKEESDQAYATAVAAAAEHAAYRQSSYSSSTPSSPDQPDDEFSPPPADKQFRRYYDDPELQIQDRMDRAGVSLPPPERSTYRSESGSTPKDILRSLSRMTSSKNSEEEDVDFSNPHVKVRAEAMKVLEMADGHTMDDASASSSTRKRTPKALAGLDFSSTGRSSGSRKPYRDDRFAIDDDDMVDVVEAERSSGGRAFDMEDDDDNSDSKNKSSWSSRYANPLNSHLSTLTGGNRSNNTILDAYDRQHARQARSGREYPSSPAASPSSGGIFGSGFSFRQKHVFGSQQPTSPSQYNIQNHRTVWSDSGGNSLPPPSPARSWQSTIERKQKRRRRLTILLILMVIAGIVVGLVYGLNKGGGGDGSGNFSMTGDEVGQSITFYATANVPFTADDGMKLEGDLAAVPGDVDFIAHLGNIQDSSITLCNEASYEDVSVILTESSVPVFVVPGAEDWNNCPVPEDGWRYWLENFEEFESSFPNHFSTDRQLGRTENFSFTHRGVLFIGLHLLAGRIPDQEEWNLRHEENLQWVEEKLAQDPDGYRAVVIFGNARPSQQQHRFFEEAVREIKTIGKPTLYVHANGGGGLEEYRPFDAKNLWAVQTEDGGASPPVKITVGFGSKPFQVGLPTPTEEEDN